MQNRKKPRTMEKKRDCAKKASQNQAKMLPRAQKEKRCLMGSLASTLLGCCFGGSRNSKKLHSHGLQGVTIRPKPNPTQDSVNPVSLSVKDQTPQVFIADLGRNNTSGVVSQTGLVITSQSNQEAGSSSLPEQVSGRCKSLSTLPKCDTLSRTLSGSVSSPFPAGVHVHKKHSSEEPSERESASGKFINKMQPAQIGHAVDIELEDIEALETEAGNAKDGTHSTLGSLPGSSHTFSQSGKARLPPIDPKYRARAMTNMKRALATVEQEEDIPSMVPIKVLRKWTNEDQKQRNQFDKLTAQIMRHAAFGDRQSMKARLLEMKKAIKEEEAALSIVKKKAKINDFVEKAGKSFDDELAKIRQRETITTDNAIERHGEAIQTLKREIKLLQDKQASKQLQYDLLRNKGFDGVLSQTVWQCRAVKLRHRFCSLSQEIEKLQDKISSHQEQIKELIPQSSVSHCSGSEELQIVIENFSQADESELPSEKEIYTLAREPRVRYPPLPRVRDLFIGGGSKDLDKPEQKMCQWTDEPCCSHTAEVGNKEGEEDSSDDEWYLTDYEDELEEFESDPTPLHRTTRVEPPHPLLPERLYTIDEETAEEDSCV